MKPFPGYIKLATTGHHHVELDRKQKQWLREVFPVTENTLVAKAMGISYPTLYRLIKKHKLKKSEEGIRAIMERARTNHRRMNHQERLRMLSGYRQERCFNIRMKAYTPVQCQCRYKAARFHNYIVYDGKDMKDGDPDRFKIFYDEETNRSKRFEETCKRHGLSVEPMKQ